MSMAANTAAAAASALSSRLACTRKSGSPALTAVPNRTTSEKPTAISITSLSTMRPPPRPTTARPSASPSIAVTKPSRGAFTSRITEASGKNRRHSSTNRIGPPCAETILPNRSAACPLASTSTILATPASASVANPALANNTPPSETLSSASGPPLVPQSTSMHSATSSALPSDGARGWLISEINALVGQPAKLAVLTKESAKASASSRVFINAPLPTFTSSTKPCSPAASFLDRIDAVIRSRLSTVPVTSRTAYSRLSAGAISAVALTIDAPASRTTLSNCASSNPV
mmetsp:Transcript_29671/g.58772  ORF Transcript_29671/g.58772 Transcript_29671/m.58772 type:complete len:289 (+) Transcript_29671:6213-7079(+)